MRSHDAVVVAYLLGVHSVGGTAEIVLYMHAMHLAMVILHTKVIRVMEQWLTWLHACVDVEQCRPAVSLCSGIRHHTLMRLVTEV